MSMELSHSAPKVTAFTMPDGDITNLCTRGISIDIPMKDFVLLVQYVLTNTDLNKDDPRLALVEAIMETAVINGYNEGHKRLDIRIPDIR